MARLNSSEAYDFSRFETGEARRAPKETKAPPKPRLVVEKPKTKQQLRREALERLRFAVKLLAVSALTLCMVGSLLHKRIEMAEIAKEKTMAETKLSQLKSENVRLKSAFNSRISLDKVEMLAREKLGMVRCERYQMYYIDLSENDKVIYYNGEAEQ